MGTAIRTSGSGEWFTPPEWIAAARTVMGGIDLDPASNEMANTIVDARMFYGPDDDGLVQPWFGRVWLNPPYSRRPGVGAWVDRLLTQDVEQAVILVNASTDTAWFQRLARACRSLGFSRSRVKFMLPDAMTMASGTSGAGQAVFGLRVDPEAFQQEFAQFCWFPGLTRAV